MNNLEEATVPDVIKIIDTSPIQHNNNVTKKKNNRNVATSLPKKSNKLRTTIIDNFFTNDPNKLKTTKNKNNNNNNSKKNQKKYHQLQLQRPMNSNDRWGDIFTEDKNSSDIRIFYQNVNSLQCKSLEKWEEILGIIKKFKIDISGMSETCTNWSKALLRNRFIAKARNIHPHSSIEFSANDYKCKDNFLPGGTLQITTGPWNCRISSSISDPQKMGRWSGSVYRLNSLSSLYVISAYRVCKQSSNDSSTHSTSTYTQQHVMLRNRSNDINFVPKPRTEFITDLITQVKSFNLRETDHLVVMMDANEEIGDEQNGIILMMNKLNLIDSIESHHERRSDDNNNNNDCEQTDETDMTCKIATYNRGVKRIDYIFSTSHTSPFIKRSGYLPFFEGFPSDHRGMFIDIDASIFDPTIQLYVPPQRHIGSSSSRKIKQNYSYFIDKQFKHQNVYNACTKMYEYNEDCDELRKLLFDTDKKVIEIMIAAEKKFALVESKWSGNCKIHLSRLLIKYWCTALRGYKTARNTHHQLEKIRHRIPSELHSVLINAPKEHYYFLLMNEKKNLNSLKLEHKVSTELKANKEYNLKSIESGIKPERMLNTDKQRNLMKQTFNELEIILKSNKKSGISHIEVPHLNKQGEETTCPIEASSWKIINDPPQIEDYMIERNIKHFNQAQGTPFTIPPLSEKLGFSSNTPFSKIILEGNASEELQTIDDIYSRMILEKLSDKNNLPPLKSSIEFNEFKSGFRKWNEKTSTSPSSKRHLGHLKALLPFIKNTSSSNKKKKKPLSEDEELIQSGFDEVNNMKDDIYKVIYTIANKAFENGISLPRWQNVTTAMIEKIPGQPKINKLRVIHLYECDYNMMLKLLWARKLVWHAHDNDSLNKGQSGSRPGFRALEVGLKKEMTYLHARLSRTGLATMDNDAKSCYDRIIVNIAMLVSKYYGMAEEACKTQGDTLEHTLYNLRTALGDSIKTYKNSQSIPIHGTGQGNCASPCIWLIICSILMDCLQNNSKGMTIPDIIKSNEELKQWIDGYVDDTSLTANEKISNATHIPQSTPNLIENLSEIATVWNGLLEASGGRLELSKCFYYLLNWKFDSEGRSSPETTEDQQRQMINRIKITESSGTETNILQKDIHESHKTLGMMKTITGDESDHLRYLRKQSNDMTTTILSNPMTRKQATIAYNVIYMSKIGYSLAAFNLSESDINTFAGPAIAAFIPRMGFKKSFPRAMAFSPKKYGGLNIPHLYTESCITKIQLLLSHIRANSHLGKLIKTNINWVQMNLGTSTPVLEFVENHINYMEPNWITGIRSFLNKCNSKISINNLWSPKKERINDKILMNEFIKLELRPAQLKLANIWRIYFKVTNLSDLCDASGQKIIPVFLKRPTTHIQAYHRKTKNNWPIQTLPGPKGWTEWKRCLKLCFNIDKLGNLPTHLGTWIIPYSLSNSTWDSYYDDITSSIFKYNNDESFSQYPIIDGNEHINFKFSTVPTNIVPSPPESAYPIDTVYINGEIYSTTPIIKCANMTAPNIPQNNNIEIQKSTWEQMILEKTIKNINNSIRSLSESNNPITLYIATDGKVGTNSNSFASTTICGDEDIIQTKGHIWNHQIKPKLARSKLLGILSALTSLRMEINNDTSLITNNKISIIVMTDYLPIVNRLNNHRKDILNKDYILDDIDIELQILKELSTIEYKGHTISINHVRIPKRNKNKNKKDKPLTLVESLMAKTSFVANVILNSPRNETIHLSFPANNAELRHKNHHITNNIKQNIREAFYFPIVQRHLQKTNKDQWTSDHSEEIWWSLLQSSLNTFPSVDVTRIQKFINNALPTNNIESKFRLHIEDCCISCGSPKEDVNHLLRCPCFKRTEIRNNYISDMKTIMENNKTHPSMTQLIIAGISAWLKDEETPKASEISPNCPVDIQNAYESQCNIGWNNFLRGKLSIKWKKALNRIEFHSDRWGKRIATTTFNFFLETWDRRKRDIYGEEYSPLQADLKDLTEQAIHLSKQENIVAYCDINYIKTSEEDILLMNSNTLRAWINNVKTLVSAFERQNSEALQPNPTGQPPNRKKGRLKKR